jgi:hypothetical protein
MLLLEELTPASENMRAGIFEKARDHDDLNGAAHA